MTGREAASEIGKLSTRIAFNSVHKFATNTSTDSFAMPTELEEVSTRHMNNTRVLFADERDTSSLSSSIMATQKSAQSVRTTQPKDNFRTTY